MIVKAFSEIAWGEMHFWISFHELSNACVDIRKLTSSESRY